MFAYYLSRVVIAIAVGALLWFTPLPWWASPLAALLVLAYFVWVPRSGRYTADSARGATMLQRDERGQQVTAQAARNGFVATMLALAAVTVLYAFAWGAAIPTTVATAVLAFGLIIYFASDYWLRRA